MKKIRVLTIIFEPTIKGYEIPKFRGAIIKKVGQDCILFHNHQGDGYRYKYPYIQYKRINHHASIVCVERGIDEINRLFNVPDWKVKIGKEEKELKLHKLYVNEYTLNVWDKTFTYKIFNWLPLNEENYKKYLQLETKDEKLQMLQKILTANILSFAKGVEWFIEPDKKIKVKILEILNEKTTYFKHNKLIAMDLLFTSNVFIPANIGLGKAVSHGYGRVIPFNKHKEDNTQRAKTSTNLQA